MIRSTFLITVEHAKHIPELCDLIAARAWTIDGVNVSNNKASAVTARQLEGNELARIKAVIREEDSDLDLTPHADRSSEDQQTVAASI